MKSGYDQFFKNARKAAEPNHTPVRFQKKSNSPKLDLDLSSEDIEQQIRRRMKMSSAPKRRKKASIPWKLVTVSFLGLILAILGFNNYEEVERFVKRVEIQMGGEAFAEAPKAAPKAEAKPAEAKTDGTETKPEAPTSLTASDLDHLQKLNDRKKELDAREEELNRMEGELQVQKEELEKRLKELDGMRTKISGILEERVKVDAEKVDTLVQMYSNMKAPQAAKVFETMDEDLAVEILGRMKKKNAADIMNLLKPEKAQVLSEMFAGYKRAPASTGK